MIRQKQLWKCAFGDSDKYIEYYFTHKAPESICLCNEEGSVLCSMAFLTFYEAELFGKVEQIPYLVGVATEESYRHQGRMTKMLQSAFEKLKEQQVPLVVLSPADKAIYEPLDFVSCYERETMLFQGSGCSSFCLRKWKELKEYEQQKVVQMAEGCLRTEKFDFRFIRSIPYYEEVNREMQALDGAVWTYWQGEVPIAVLNYIHENGEDIFTEVICARSQAKKVVANVMYELPNREIRVEDCHFLCEVRKDAMKVEKQAQPYLMAKNLCWKGKKITSCYVNDIT